MIEAFLNWLVQFVHDFGYVGIFIMTLLESTFMPVPSEVTILPAGYLVYQGKMNGPLVFVAGTLGTLVGSLINYWIARKFGRPLIIRYGKYFFLTEKRLDQVEAFFQKHGAISTFTGRLITGVRHFIAFPAGLARMPIKSFVTYTLLGGALWTAILIGVGYLIGYEKKTITTYIPYLKIGIAAFALLIFLVQVYRRRQKKSAE